MVNPATDLSARGVNSLPDFFGRYRDELARALRASLDEGTPGLYDLLRYHMGWADPEGRPQRGAEGKALRPTLCLFSCEAVGGEWRRAMPGAVALELIHNFSLVHDDIQDRDEERHHRPTVWSIWGEPKALAAGNGMRGIADRAVWDLLGEGLPESIALEVSRLLSSAYLEMIEGQYLDLSFEARLDIGVEDYLAMISLKTGALLRCSMHIGALTGTEDGETRDAFSRCGTALGQVFQIRDDLLGVWGKEEITGKPVGEDILRKKMSFPIVYALNMATDKEREVLYSAYAEDAMGEDDAGRVLGIMEGLGVIQSGQELAERKCHEALEALGSARLTPGAMNEIEELVAFLLTRNR